MSEIKALEISISANIPALKEVEKLAKQFQALATAIGKVQELSSGKGASGAPGIGVSSTAEAVTKDIEKQAVAAKKAVGSVAVQWEGATLAQKANIRKWGTVSVDEIKKAMTAQERQLQDANKIMTQRGFLGFGGAGQTSGKSAKESAKVFESYFKELDRVSRLNKKMTAKGGFEWLTGAQARKNAEKSAKVFEKFFAAQGKLQKALGDEYNAIRSREIAAAGWRTKAIEANNKVIMASDKKLLEKQMRFGEEWVAQRKLWLKRSLNEVLAYKNNEATALGDSGKALKAKDKFLRSQVSFGDKYMQSVGKIAQRYGISVDPEKARGGMQVVSGADSQWMKHGGGVYVKTAEDAKRLRGEVEKLGFTVAEKQGKLRGFATEVGSMMRTQARWFAGAGLIFTGMAAVGTAVKSTMEFYQNLKNIQAITGESEEGIKAVGRAALEVAENTPVAAGEASKFALKLIQAGLEADQAAIAMRTVAELVTVTGEDSTEVAKAVTTAMFAWRKEASEIPGIGQTIAAALNYSRLTVQDLGVAFNYLASTSSLMGKSLEETTAIMAVLNNMGIRASTIGTGISQLFTELIVPSKKFRGELERMGIALGDVDPTVNKFADIVDRLKEKGFSAGKAYDVLQVRAGRQLAAALVATGDAFRIMEERIKTSTQLTEGLAKAKEGPIAKLKIMRNQLENAAILMGSISIPAIGALTGAMTILTTIIRQVAQGVSTLVEGFGPKFISVVMLLGLAVIGVTKIYQRYAVAALGAASATGFFSRALVILTAAARANPIIAALTAVAAVLGLIGFVAGKSTKELRKALNEQAIWTKHRAKESEDLQNRLQLEEQAVTALKDEWSRLGQEGNRSKVAFELDVMLDGFHQIAKSVRDLNVEIEILQKKMAEPPDEGSWLDRMVKAFAAVNAAAVGQLPEGIEKEFDDAKKKKEELNNFLNKALKDQDELLASALKQSEKIRKGVGPSIVDKRYAEAFSYEPDSEFKRVGILLDQLKGEIQVAQKGAAEVKEAKKAYFDTYAQAVKGGNKELAIALSGTVSESLKEIEVVEASAFGPVGKKMEALMELIGEVKKRIVNAAQKAKDALETVSDEYRRFQFDLSQIGRDDPFAGIFMSGIEEADRLSRRIRDIERQILEVGQDRKAAAAAGDDFTPAVAILDKHLSYLKEQQSILEGQKGQVPKKTEAELRAKANEVILDQTRQQIQLEQELGRLSPMDAFNREIEADRQILALETMRLEVQKELAKEDEERMAALLLFEKALAGRKRIQELKEEIGAIKAMNAEYARAQEALDLLGTMGGDVSLSKQYLDFHQKMNNIIKQRPELADMAEASLSRMYDAMTWMNRSPSEEAWNGFLMNLKIGVEQAYQGLGNAFEWVKRIGADAVNTLQRSSSDFFFNLSTAQGFDREQHNSFWRYFQDVVDDFLKSVYQGFMRTLADIWSQWLTGGIMDMLGGLLDGKNSIASSDANAAAQSMTLTGALSAQVGVVGALTSAYWALAVAKAAAGMGGGVSTGDSHGTFMGGNFATSLDVPHTGGLILHNGGFVPRYHRGGKVLPSERMALLEVGEFVVNRRSAARNKEALMAINNGQDAGGGQPIVVNNYNISAVDSKSFDDAVRRNRGSITGAVNRDMRYAGPTRQAMRKYL